MSNKVNNVNLEEGSNKSFGILFAIVFLIIGLYPLIAGESIHLWIIAISVIFLMLAYLAPKILTIPNRLWFNLGIMLGSIVAPIVMAIIYFCTVVPTGLIMRLIGKDLLHKKLDKNVKTYWIERSEPVGTMKNQF